MRKFTVKCAMIGPVRSPVHWNMAPNSSPTANELTVHGRKRADVTVARDADQVTVEAAVLSLDAVQKALDGKPARKIIVVPQRIVNVVA